MSHITMETETSTNAKRLRLDDDELQMSEKADAMLEAFQANKNPTVEESLQNITTLLVSLVKSSATAKRELVELQSRTSANEASIAEIKETLQAVQEHAKEQSESLEAMTDRVEKLEAPVEDIQRQLERHEWQINSLHTTAQISERSLHQLEQIKVDNDVFLSGFPKEPDVEKVASEVLKHYDIDASLINYKYRYQLKARRSARSSEKPAVIHHVVIGFKDNAAKVKLLKAKKDKGPLTFGQMYEGSLTTLEHGKLITCTNRLSKFNLMVLKHLFTAKDDKYIHSFQLHNGVFRLKMEENSDWISISTGEALQPFIKSANVMQS